MGLKSNPRLGLLSPIHTLWLHPHPWDQVHFNCRFSMHCGIIYIQSIVVRFPIPEDYLWNQAGKLSTPIADQVHVNWKFSPLFLNLFERNMLSEGYVASFFVICQPLQSFEWSPDKSTMIHPKSSEGHSNLLSVFNTRYCKKFCENPSNNIIQLVSYK